MEEETHFYFLFFIGAAFVLSFLTVRLSLVFSRFFTKEEPSDEQKDPYAGGFSELSSLSHSFTVRFFLAALFFMLVTAEILFLLPWVVACRLGGFEAAIGAFVFLFFCAVGGFYEYKRGALQWKL